jgi:hypothetical protein
MPSPRRFPPPWSIEERQESFIVKDANGQPLAYLYFEDEPQRRMSMKRLSRDEAFLIAVNIAKLPSVRRPIRLFFRPRRCRWSDLRGEPDGIPGSSSVHKHGDPPQYLRRKNPGRGIRFGGIGTERAA